MGLITDKTGAVLKPIPGGSFLLTRMDQVINLARSNSLWPLVFGTLKATLYSMLFGAPIALLAAIFSSEFLAPALRTRVKTLIEFMASLPSVVLGFLAALVFAPFVQRLVPTALVSFLTIPGTILLGSYIWQLLPQRVTLRLAQFRLLFPELLQAFLVQAFGDRFFQARHHRHLGYRERERQLLFPSPGYLVLRENLLYRPELPGCD